MPTLDDIKRSVYQTGGEFPLKRVDLFGSFAKGTATSHSDVDFLVEFETDSVSLLTLSRLKLRLEELLQTSVDVVHAPLPPDSIITIGERVCIYEGDL